MTRNGKGIAMATEHDPERCKSVYVSWVWLVGILTALMCGAMTVAWTGGSHLVKSKYEIKDVGVRVNDHERRIIHLESVQSDIDSIKAWVRPDHTRTR